MIHHNCSIGDVQKLKKNLSHRKFSIAKESKTNYRLTPLHTAIIFNHSSIVRYLAEKFPETLSATDTNGRTGLHFASIFFGEGGIYNLLLSLGAYKDLCDKYGKSAEHYLHNPDETIKTVILSEVIPGNKKSSSSKIVDQKSQFYKISMEINKKLASAADSPCLQEYNGDLEKKDLPSLKVNFLEEDQTVQKYISIIEIAQLADRIPKVFQSIDRDDYGQTVLHLVAARTNSHDSLFQMINDLDCNIGHRDQLYRTPRDIAAISKLYENVKAIDKYVLYLVAKGETERIFELLVEGYNYILNLENDVNIVDIAIERNHLSTVAVLQLIPTFEKTRENLHKAIRRGDKNQLEKLLKTSGKDGKILAVVKNDTSRCSLHISVLLEYHEIVQFLINQYPETIHVKDNIDRTVLHYAMALETVEFLTKILIEAGADKTVKDLKGRQPSYYFMNKSDILKLRKEEEILRGSPQ